MDNNFMKVENDMHNIILRQMGAKVEAIRGVMYYVRFQIEDITIKYVYHINKKGRYYLQRRAPYPLNVGSYESEDDVINIITHDIAQMKNAMHSKMFNKFIDTSQNINTLLRQFDDLYLYYNIPQSQLEKFESIVSELQTLVSDTKEKSERVYYDKEPDAL